MDLNNIVGQWSYMNINLERIRGQSFFSSCKRLHFYLKLCLSKLFVCFVFCLNRWVVSSEYQMLITWKQRDWVFWCLEGETKISFASYHLLVSLLSGSNKPVPNLKQKYDELQYLLCKCYRCILFIFIVARWLFRRFRFMKWQMSFYCHKIIIVWLHFYVPLSA